MIQGSKQRTCVARLKDLPSLTALQINKLDAYITSPSLYFSVVQDLALLLLFLQHHLPVTNRRWLLPLLSPKYHTLWTRPCRSHQCEVACFCIHRFETIPSWSQDEKSNIWPWFNIFLIVLARHVALFRVQAEDQEKPEANLYLYILNTDAWLFLLQEVQQLLFSAGVNRDEQGPQQLQEKRDKSSDTALWKTKKSKFEKAWNVYLKTQRFLHLKSYDLSLIHI